MGAGAILLVAALWQYSGGRTPGGKADESDTVLNPPPHLHRPIRAEVLNGCGIPQAAARLTKKARALGIDVIDEGNAESFAFLQTMVIDRSGDLDKARQVAAILGIPRCIQQIRDESFRLAHVSIIIGRDHQQLGLLEYDEGDTHSSKLRRE